MVSEAKAGHAALRTWRYVHHATPIGPLLLAGTDTALCRIDFARDSMPAPPGLGWRHDPAAFAAARRQLDEYFAGTRIEFDLTLEPTGTPFQQAVWRALRAIPYGQAISYGELARHLGRPQASRAVGAANGANPLPIVVPCHRVIGSHGELTGFGGGLAIKRWLLDHERRHAPVEPLSLAP